MSRDGRRLTPGEADLWARVAKTVIPMRGRRMSALLPEEEKATPSPSPRRKKVAVSVSPAPEQSLPPRGEERRSLDCSTLDAGWDRRLAKGMVAPDFTLDLHGSTLDAAHSRLDQGLTLALAQGARLVLLITGRPRPGDAAGRGERRGAIRAKFLDWLANGSHSAKIAAVRPAHPRHGGAGAVYIVLRRPR
ncbi:MAG TPA: Smr/MutS family protein [Novosphingobium sp.]